jgi:hypothetical protein
MSLALFQLFPEETKQLWLEENGPVETFSALGYFVCASIAVCWFGWQLRYKWYLVAILLLMGMRELDFHSRFTTMGVFKLRFFSSDAVPWSEKLIVTTLLLGIGFALILALRKEMPKIVMVIRQRPTLLVGVYCGLALAVLSKTIDGLARKLSAINVAAPDWFIEMASDAEEIMELAIPIMFTTALLQHIFAAGRKEQER